MALEVKTKIGHPPPEDILVLMDKIEKEEISKGGIVIVKENDNRQYAQAAVSTGIIKEIGKGCWKRHGDGEPWAKVGDRVWFEKYQGQEYIVGQDDYRTMPYYSIRMVLPQEEF